MIKQIPMTKRTAIVTGSSGGIGEAIVRRLAKNGYTVCINDIAAKSEAIDAVVSSLVSEYGKDAAIGVVADVTKVDEVRDMIQQSVTRLGPLTVFVANAGISQSAPILKTSEADVMRLVNVNFIGVWNCYTCAAQQMIDQGPVETGSTGYKIIGAASITAFKAVPLFAAYSATKWAVRGLTQAFAMEMACHNINVNAYAPGFVQTPLWTAFDENGEIIKRLAHEQTAMGRVSVPEDVAKVVGGFLAGEESSFITGQTIVVDGGTIFN